MIRRSNFWRWVPQSTASRPGKFTAPMPVEPTGMQGVGGLETVWLQNQVASVGAVQDVFGNLLASVTNGTVSWNSNRFNSYGPVPGYESPAISPNVGLLAATGWRGRRVDETGLVQLGARPYDPTSGRFLSADPMGHSASPDLFSFCGGDPVNNSDPTGRDWRQTYSGFGSGTSSGFSTAFGDMEFGPYGISMLAGGMFFNAYSNPFEGAFDNIHPGEFAADAILNQSARDYARNEWNHADWHSPWGIAVGVMSGVSYTANTIDAGANLIPIIGSGKALIENSIKAGIKGVAEIFAKDVTKEVLEVGVKDVARVGAREAARLALPAARSAYAVRSTP